MSLVDFQQFDAPDLIINIWTYNETKKHLNICDICQRYSDLSIQALREKWEKEWGDMDYLVEKIKKRDTHYFNIGKYSSATKHQIIDFLKKYNKKN